ncbi:hypothetical protein [Bradyrhizobium sp. RD5-C2]|uniref:hypothetical protein n=1 Tax=Bradyrhizobium sp. RD5-C2 TaxID=244562 RepID=UPI001CC42867|nr:hypothetical protein [Bradyrhizobium sp. RD5-C2]GIQ79015.1 hypothetical protein BraRD5C2_74670 [Bradyrhizobium sp. RD5-C2]
MSAASHEKQAAADRFSFTYFVWVMLVGLLFAFGSDLDRIFNLWLMLVPALFLPAVAVTLYCTAALIRNLWLRRWRRVASILVAPVAAYLFFAGVRAVGVSPELIRFEIGKRDYIAQIEKLPETGEPRLATFDWGQTGGAGVANFVHTLVFDESDEIARTPAQRSLAWRDRVNRLCPGTPLCSLLNPPAGFSVAVKQLDGHFYLVTEGW